MSNLTNCEECGTEIPTDAPAGMCPKCLMKVGVAGSARASRVTLDTNVPTSGSAETVSYAGRDEAATVTIGESGERAADFGDYELLEEIARGGMGVVFKARQVSLNRMVALKMIKAGELADEVDVRRFRAEAEAAANLDHPNIVPIYEVGEHDGRHFFSMGFVVGASLHQRLTDGPLPPKEAAQLMWTIAESVQFAHDRGIVHRDLKPANVLLDAHGRPKVTDFGLAKNIAADSGMTATGQIMGTPSFMPPEQAEGRVDEVGPPSDVYSLGAMLYAMLTGRPPFQAANAIETVRQVLEREPVSPRQLNPAVDRDLETICLKCLEKVPARRYATAAELARELRRFLDNRPILARPATRYERAVKWVQRKPLVAGLFGTIVVAVVTVLSALTYAYFDVARANEGATKAWRSEKEQRKQAEERELQARTAQRETRIALADLYTTSGVSRMEEFKTPEAVLWAAHAARLSVDDEERNYANRVRARLWRRSVPVPVRALWHDGKTVRTITFHKSGRYLLTITQDNTCFMWDVAAEKRMKLPGGGRSVGAAVWSPDGARLFLGSMSGGVMMCRFPALKVLRKIEFETPVRAMAVSANGKRLAIAGHFARVWDIDRGAFITQKLIHPREALTVSFSSSGDTMVTGGNDDVARIYNVDQSTDKPRAVQHKLRLFAGQPPNAPRLINQDRGLLTFPVGNGLAWYDLKTLKLRSRRYVASKGLLFATATPDGQKYAVGGFGGYCIIWDGKQWIRVRVQQMKGVHVRKGVFTPDGKLLVTVDDTGIARAWSTQTGEQVGTDLKHTFGLKQLALSADGKWLAAAQEDGLLRVWDFSTVKGPSAVQHVSIPIPAVKTGVKFNGDGKYLLVAGSSRWFGKLRTARVYDTKAFKPASPPMSTGELLLDAAISNDGRQVVTGDVRKWLTFWDRKNGTKLPKALELPSEPRTIEYTPDGEKIICLCVAGEILVVNPVSVEVQSRMRHDSETVREQAAFTRRYTDHAYTIVTKGGIRRAGGGNPGFGRDYLRITHDGKWLITGRLDESLIVWNLASGRPRYAPLRHKSHIRSFDLSHEERFVATGDQAGSVRVWEFVSGKPVGTTMTHPSRVNAVDFSSDGRHLVTACADGMARIWNWRTGTLTTSPMPLLEAGREAVFTPDGRWVLTGSRLGTVLMWDRKTGKRVALALATGMGEQLRIVFTPNQSHAVIFGDSANIRVKSLNDFRPDEKLDADALCTLSEILSSRRIENSGVVNLTTIEWLQRWRRFRVANSQCFRFP